jgi:hypothetical protein
MRLLAIDPGNEESAAVIYDTADGQVLEFHKMPNGEMLGWLWAARAVGCDLLAIEMIASYGMPVGAEVFDTCVWIGRFLDRWDSRGHARWVRIFRKNVKLHLCGTTRAKDPNVRQALIDRYGGKEKAIGKKAMPGPLYGMKGDCWAALAVAVTAAEGNEL